MTTKPETPTLAKLREPFPAHQISKLPKPYKKDSPKGKCAECGGYHGLPALHLDYVGHAALTDRLLDTDPEWNWEPMGLNPDGTPALDRNGGLWIKLTVCGVTRPGYGCADGKSGGDAMKEIIGDALRNAAMRFGAALDLWHKGDLHADSDDSDSNGVIDDAQFAQLQMLVEKSGTNSQAFCEHYRVSSVAALPKGAFEGAAAILKKRLAQAAQKPNPQHDEVLADEIPY